MKKLFAVGVLFVIAGFAFGQEISFGGGVSYGADWLAGGATNAGISATDTSSAPPLGFHAFVDAKYIQGGIGYLINSTQTVTTTSGGTSTTTTQNDHISWLDLDLVGKYPIKLGGFTIFPLVGFEYLMNVVYTDSNGNPITLASDQQGFLNEFFIKAGIGGDISLSDHFYVRPEAFVGYKLIRSQWDTDMVNMLTSAGATGVYWNWWEVRGMVLVGYRL